MPSPKRRFFRAFKKHFFLRSHMSLILPATGLGGLLGTKILMWSGVRVCSSAIPFNVVIATLCAWQLQVHYPEMVKLSDLF